MATELTPVTHSPHSAEGLPVEPTGKAPVGPPNIANPMRPSADTLELTGQNAPSEAPQAPVVVAPAAALEQPGLRWHLGNWMVGSNVDTALEGIDAFHVDNPDLISLAGRGLESVATAAGVEAERDGATLTLRAGSDSRTYSLPADPDALAGTVEQVLETLRRSSQTNESWDAIEAEFLRSLVPHLGPYARFSPRREEPPRSEFTDGFGLALRPGPNGTWFALQPDPESAAARAGITHGTRITTLGELQLADATPEQVIEALRGDSIAVEFQIGSETRSAELDRTSFRRDAVTLADVDENGVGHIVISRFDRDVATQVQEVLDSTVPPLRGLVLDLRGNAGGSVEAAESMVRLFQNRHPMYEVERADDSEWVASQRGAPYPDIPLAVLVDSETASASELVVGGLARFPSFGERNTGQYDRNRAVVLGASTFGKATITRSVGPLLGPQLTFGIGRVNGPFGHYEGRGYTPALCSAAVATGPTDMNSLNAMIGAGAACEHELRVGISEDLDRARTLLADPALLERALRNDASIGVAAPRR